jgi:hypothetical protein
MFTLRRDEQNAQTRFLDLRLATLQVTIAQAGGVTRKDGSSLTVDDFRLLHDEDEEDGGDEPAPTSEALEQKAAAFEARFMGWATVAQSQFTQSK